MATQITNYQCPSCTGPLHYDGDTGKLKCDYCSSEYAVDEIEKLYAEKIDAAEAAGVQQQTQSDGWSSGSLGSDWGAEAENMRAYSCPSCGAELICDATTAATSCPYCGNPTVVPAQFHGVLKPDYVIPFKLDKKAAEQALRNHYKGKKFLPTSFASDNHISEIKGVYVPFWLFDGTADADFRFAATRVHTHTTGKERVTVTEHYKLRRAGTVDFRKIPVDGSSKMPDAHMDAIEPYDYSGLKPFSTAYLPGFMADKYDVSADESVERAKERAENTVETMMLATVAGYSSCVPTQKDTRILNGKAQYALMPVWMLNTKWNGKDYLFAMNGQTGKLIGDLPVSMFKFFAWFAGISIPLMAVLSFFMFGGAL